MFLIETERCYSIFDYKKFTTEDGKIFLYKLLNGEDNIEEYLRNLYSHDNEILKKICNDLDRMMKYGMIRFKKLDPYKPLVSQISDREIMIYFNSLTLTDGMVEILKK